MKNRRGLEVAHRLVIHVSKPCTITVTALGRGRMLADAPIDAARFEEQKNIKGLRKAPLANYIDRSR